MSIIFGSARQDERGKLSGGAAGDQTGKEVSTQDMYKHKLGWYIFRPKSVSVADKLALAMTIACNNPNIGYDQSNRLGVVKNGVSSLVKTETDCSALVRACCIFAGFDPGNFTTANEISFLEASGMFEKKKSYNNQESTPVFNGDILVTRSKGHTGIIVSGNPRLAYSMNGVNYAPVFDPTYYANKWPDVTNALGTNSAVLFKHFCEFGMREGRQAISTFDVIFYKNHNEDLRAAFGNDLPSYYKHFCVFGKAEGRRGV